MCDSYIFYYIDFTLLLVLAKKCLKWNDFHFWMLSDIFDWYYDVNNYFISLDEIPAFISLRNLRISWLFM